jgi:hypothetical protein
MKIYTPAVVEGGEWIGLGDSDPEHWEALFALYGPVGSEWRAPRMHFIREQEDGTARQYSDFPWCLHNVLVIRERALQSLQPMLAEYGELLPLLCEEPVSLFNVTNIVDALDEERSTIVRFDDGQVLAIEKHVFRPKLIAGAEIFRLPGRASNIYLHETLVRRIGELGLMGLAFEMVWADEMVPANELRIEYPAGTRSFR